MAFEHKVHHFAKKKGGDGEVSYRLAKVTPLIRLGSPQGSIYLQNGMFLDEGGNEVKQPPAWVYEEVSKITKEALSEAGFKEAPVPPSVTPPQVKVGGPELKKE